MFGADRGRSGPQRSLALLVAIGLLGLFGMLGTLIWAASSWDSGGMMGNDHMSRMMGGGGRDASRDPATQGGPDEAVAIEDFVYRPGNLQIAAGSKVTWTNNDSAPHSATESGRTWDTGVLARGKSATITFRTPGTFEYFCTVHPSMKGRIEVR